MAVLLLVIPFSFSAYAALESEETAITRPPESLVAETEVKVTSPAPAVEVVKPKPAAPLITIDKLKKLATESATNVAEMFQTFWKTQEAKKVPPVDQSDAIANKAAAKTVEKLTGEGGVLTQIGGGVKGISNSIANMFGILGILSVCGVVSVILLIILVTRISLGNKQASLKSEIISQNSSVILKALQVGFEATNKKIDEIPAAVKKVDQIVITDLIIGKRKVTFKPKIENNYHLSLRIPIGKVEQVSDPSKIVRTPTNDRGRLVETTIAAFKLIDANGNDLLTKLTQALIGLAVKSGEITVVEIS